jgi:hypothetical protein
VLGQIFTAYTAKHVVLLWNQCARVTDGQMVVSGPVRRYAILNSSGWSEPKPAARMPRGNVFEGPFARAPFLGLHIDQQDRVHMAWGSGPFNYHAIVAELGKAVQK